MFNVGLASFGMSGQLFHAPFIETHSGFKLKKILERTKNLSKEKYPDATIVRNFYELLTEDIDLVIINTPDSTHYELSKEAIVAGKNIVVEKPFTTTSKNAKDLIRLAYKHNVFISVYQNRRFDSDFLTLKKVLKNNEIGEVVEMRSYFERYRNFVKEKKKDLLFGQGAIYNLGSHLIDQAITLFGMPKSVFADIQSLREGSLSDDYFDLKLFYPNKRVILKSSYLAKFNDIRFIVQGTKGAYIKYGDDIQEKQLDQGILPASEGYGREDKEKWGHLIIHKDGGDIEKRIESINGNYSLFYDDIHKTLSNNHTPEITAEDGLKVIQIIEAALESNEQRRVIEIKN